MNEVLQAILASKKVTTDSGIERPLDYHIDSAEGEFVQSLIRKHRPRVVLEVGCAAGDDATRLCPPYACCLIERASWSQRGTHAGRTQKCDGS
jgi:hypothetical protein